MTHSLALALLQTAPSGGGMSIQGIVFQVLMFVAIFYFLLIRPQQKQRKQQEQTLMTLKKGDDIVTAGGIMAQVVHIAQKVVEGTSVPALDDAITIRSGESKLIVERSKIARVISKVADAPASP
jgi:preprotein translocase subunit YajC